MPIPFSATLSRRLPGFSILEVLISFSLFGVLLASVMALFRNEIKELGFAGGEASRDITFLRIENALSRVINPKAASRGEEDLWTAGEQMPTGKSAIGNDAGELPIAGGLIFRRQGNLVFSKGRKEEVLFHPDKKYQISSLTFKKERTFVVAKVTLTGVDDNPERTFRIPISPELESTP